ncbi:unnamed protein product [Rotaria magnacalcarata]|uniref:MULE transposase domain-containing protein n=2 Tax=Rotaria magnacalcarata TaxID=392030 RepID=A0A815Z7I4_9BILA|nr:unnamed protein product [Rotaria magnacalcarata]CAF4053013.1 unnamed protein product [Rotaria magnacalcarata]
MPVNTSSISFLHSNKGYRQLIRNGFIYKFNKQTSSMIYLICKTKNCKAKVHTDSNNNILDLKDEHNHLLEPEDFEVQCFRNILKDRVINETEPISKIYDEESAKAQFSPETLASVPMVRDIQPGLNQARRKLTLVLPTSTTFDIPVSYQRTATGFPCVFGLLPDRKKSTYQQLFQELKDVAVSMNRIWKPDPIISDFETSLIPAISAEFPQTLQKGCYFHHIQSIYRCIQNLGFATVYSEDEEIRTCCRKLMALAFLPLDEVESFFYNLLGTVNSRVKELLRQLFLYHDDYWINKNIVIPQNVMELENDQFFDFVKQCPGEKVALLLKFQDISNVDCFLGCNDPFEILSFDSNDLLDLKKEIGVKLNNNSYVILPGVKCKVNMLKNALVKLSNQLKKTSKTLSDTVIRNSTLTTDLIVNNSNNSANTFSVSLMTTSASPNNNLTPEEKLKLQTIESLNDWCQKMKESNGQKMFQLKENIDYEIFIDIIGKKVLVKCQCGKTTMLGQKDNNFILSNFFRHLIHRNPCRMVQEKLECLSENSSDPVASTFDNMNASVETTINPTSNINSSIQTSTGKRKGSKTLNPSVIKKKKRT